MDTPYSCYLGCYAAPTTGMKRVFPSISPLPHQFSTPIFHHPTSHCTISLACNFSHHPFILGPSPDLICLPLLPLFLLPFHTFRIFHLFTLCHPSFPLLGFLPSVSDVSVAFLQWLMYNLQMQMVLPMSNLHHG